MNPSPGFLPQLSRFFHDSRAIGLVLTLCTIVSLLLANTGAGQQAYVSFWLGGFDGTAAHHGEAGWFHYPNSFSLLINDGLMALFFLLVGMEIKREFVEGELASVKRAVLPVTGAIGGMIAPAILFLLFNKGNEYRDGWAIPTATDIAFTLGIAGLLGRKVPAALKLFITALAIIDDLLAIIVIAFFYGGAIHASYLLGAAGILAALWLLNKTRMRFGPLQWLLGAVLWYMVYRSGIHATIAGVLFAMMMPSSALRSYEQSLYFPVYFLIIPLFALSNTAIPIPGNPADAFGSTLSWGILVGLCIGKPLGILTACYLMVRRKMTVLPKGTGWATMAGGAMLCGIGFTMSIFIASLAFGDPAWQDIAKLSVMCASAISIIAGSLWLQISAGGSR